jgi:hypothetical protein
MTRVCQWRPYPSAWEPGGLECSGRSLRRAPRNAFDAELGCAEISRLKQIYNRFLRHMFLSSGIPGSLLSVYRKGPALSHPASSAPPGAVVAARRRGGFGSPAAGRSTGEPTTSVKTARKWRRNRLKRLNQRPEMVWSQKPRSHNIWYATARLTARSDRELREIARCRTEVGACLLPSERRACIRLSPKRDVVVVMSRSPSLCSLPSAWANRRSQRQNTERKFSCP